MLANLKEVAAEATDALAQLDPIKCPGCYNELRNLILEINNVTKELSDSLAIACAIRTELAQFDCGAGNWEILGLDVKWKKQAKAIADLNSRLQGTNPAEALKYILDNCCCDATPPNAIRRTAGCQPDGSEWREMVRRCRATGCTSSPTEAPTWYDPTGRFTATILRAA